MVGQSSGPALPFPKLFAASAVAACTAEIATLPLGGCDGLFCAPLLAARRAHGFAEGPA